MSRKKNLGKFYHTAVGEKFESGLTGITRFEADGNIAIAHDITKGILPEYQNADVIYSEPCWRAGYEKFASTVGVKQRLPYNDYLQIQSNIVRNLGIPAFIMSGVSMIKHLKADAVVDIWFEQHDCPAYINVYNADKSIINGCKTNEDVIDSLCQKFNVILDFNSGYGNICEHALKYGKHFICTDLCPTAIEYVAINHMGMK